MHAIIIYLTIIITTTGIKEVRLKRLVGDNQQL